MRPRITDVQAYFWARVDQSGGPDACWPWKLKPMNSGYGQVGIAAWPRTTAHRMAYELTHGAIPDELVVDHECHNRDATCTDVLNCPHRLCCNPAHLAAKTRGENVAAARETRRSQFCPQNHEFTPENTKLVRGKRPGSTYRQCRACLRAHASASYANKQYLLGRVVTPRHPAK